jgi:hypothetical protein
VRTSGAEELRKVREELARAGVASDYLNTFLGQTSIELTKARAKTRTYSEETKALAQQYGLSVEGLDKLNRRIRDSDAVYEEATQKLEDARKKLDEYGATAEQQAAAIGLIFKSAERTNIPLAKQALIMEELAIELQDADAATRLYDQALSLVEKRGGRVEDRVAELTEAYKGQTSALGNLGPVAKSAVSGLDELRSQQLKAVEVKKRFDRESTRQLTTLDKLNDRLTLGKVRFAEFTATLGPAGQVAGVVAGAFVALGAGALKVATDATTAYIESNILVKESLSGTTFEVKRLQIEVGRTVAELVELDDLLLGIGGTARQTRDGIIYLKREYGDLASTILRVHDAVQFVIGDARTPGSAFGVAGGVLQEFAVGLGQLAFDVVAEEERQTRRESELLTQELVNQETEWQRLNAFLEQGDVNYRQLQKSAAAAAREMERTQRIGQVSDAESLLRGSLGVPQDAPRQGPLLPNNRFDAVIPKAPKRGGGFRAGSRADAFDVLQGFIEEVEDEQERVVGFIREGLANRIGRDGQEFVQAGKDRAEQFIVGALSYLRVDGADDLTVAVDNVIDLESARRRRFRDRTGLSQESFSAFLEENEIDLNTDQGVRQLEEMLEASDQLNAGLNRLATQGLANLTFGFIDLATAAAFGQVSVADFGTAFLANLGGVLEQAGEGMFLLGLGTLNIISGLTNPAALIATGAGLKIIGSAMSAYGSRSSSGRTSGGGGGGTSATREAFRESTDRLLAEQDRERQAIYVLADFGGAIVDVPVQRINRRLDRQGLAA